MDVLYSIRPEWCKSILEGLKVDEIRKDLPRRLFKGGVSPFTGYIYCTNGKQALFRNEKAYRLRPFKDVRYYLDLHHEMLNGKVIAKFECWQITPMNSWYMQEKVYNAVHYLETRVPYDDCVRYLNGGHGYAIRMSFLDVFKEPLALSDFGLKRAPQSWCYVERRI